MCGIVGMWGAHASARAVREAMGLLRHRGPDGEGVFEHERCVLGHRRLSIVDVEGGAQPLYNEDRTVALVHNGEIYNHARLAAPLRERHGFATRSDGEALLHLWEEAGAAGTFPQLSGMFAVALWDGRELALARDPIGIKPLYWSRSGDGIAFASEFKALLKLAPAERIELFPPGHYFTTGGGLRRFWSTAELPPPEEAIRIDRPVPGDEDGRNADDRLFELVESSVRRRLMSDVPVGVFLSGGLDSSLIAALMARHIPNLHSFAVGFKGSDDLAKAELVAKHVGTIHHALELDRDEIVETLPKIVFHLESFDVDLIRSAVPCWFVSREAARHVKVVLTGEGADELFAGYTYYNTYDEAQLHPELVRSVGNLHPINLQRVDRMSMAHGLEARVPFLDLSVVQYAMRLPVSCKRRDGLDKIALRRVAARVLPESIAWRPKLQFDQGSGCSHFLSARSNPFPGGEEHFYRDLFKRHFPQSAQRLVVRWSAGRLAG
ncbi:MAG: asparagine synthase (glutamine-hydrolyzing) [Planctomycetota bacterium]|nr:asparagine synthase (glutamine-hydrolyzing) [Planctomycetota bacterium]